MQNYGMNFLTKIYDLYINIIYSPKAKYINFDFCILHFEFSEDAERKRSSWALEAPVNVGGNYNRLKVA